MASFTGSSYASSLETTNYARICRIVVDVLRDILWQVLTNEILPADLPKKVQTDIKKLGKLDLKIKTWLCGISIPSTKIPSAEKFDVSSLYTLIRNLCSQVPTPTNQWGGIPSASGITLGDDIERVREFRNTLYGHATQAKIETAEFNKLCIEIKNIVSRFDAYFCSLSKTMKCDFQCEIDTILTCFMDKSLEEDYIDKMKEIVNLSDDLRQIKHQVADNTKTMYDVQKDVKEIKEIIKKRSCRTRDMEKDSMQKFASPSSENVDVGETTDNSSEPKAPAEPVSILRKRKVAEGEKEKKVRFDETQVPQDGISEQEERFARRVLFILLVSCGLVLFILGFYLYCNRSSAGVCGSIKSNLHLLAMRVRYIYYQFSSNSKAKYA